MKQLMTFPIVYAGFLFFPALYCAGLYLLQTRGIEPSASPVRRWLAALAYSSATIALWWAIGRPEAGGDGAPPASLSRMFAYSSFVVLPIAAAVAAASVAGSVVCAVSSRKLRWIMAAGAAGGLAYVVFFPHPYTPMPRPVERSFEGRWFLDPASIPSVEKRTGRAPARSEMRFGSDGTLVVTDMPYEEPRRSPEFALVSGKGRWDLSLQQDWVMTFTLDERRYGTLFIELKEGRPAALMYGVVDPDSSERWIWRRAASKAP